MRPPPPATRLAELIGAAHAFQYLEELRHGLLGALLEAVPSDRASYNEFDEDPARSWWASEPYLPITPEQADTFTRLVPQNPILAHINRTHDGRPRRISDFMDQEEYHRLELYREFYVDVGCEHQVGFTLPSGPPIVIGIALIRADRDFEDPEIALLAAARPHLIQAYRNAELASARAATITALEEGLEALGSPVMVVDARGRVGMATPTARRLLTGRMGGPRGQLAEDIVATLAARRAAGTPATEPLLIREGDQVWSVRVLRGPESDSELLIVEPGASGLNVPALQSLGLTRREAEALRWLALGRRGPEIAGLLQVSPRTVEKHLQNAYAKLGVHSASAAAATAWAAVGVRLPAPPEE